MNYYKQQYSIEKMSKALQVSKSGYYYWATNKGGKRAIENAIYLSEIKRIYGESKKRYGSLKITEDLKAKGYKVSRKRVARLMKEEGLKSIICKKFKVNTTDSNHKFRISKNLLKRQFSVKRPSKAWVSDITYIRTGFRWSYLTIVMDLYDRKIIGWSFSKTLKTIDTTIPAFEMATVNRKVSNRLIFHSDRGVQYACQDFRDVLSKHKLKKQSMSRKGNCWDNAVAENFFKILKSELVYHKNYTNFEQAKLDIFEFIEIWYNNQRRHSRLGYKTPNEFSKYLMNKLA